MVPFMSMPDDSNGGACTAQAPLAQGLPPVPEEGPGFGIYVHWPFCLSKCPYCDFNSHVTDAVDTDAWRRAFLRALDWFAARTRTMRVTSVFFGGGTPSLMPPALVEVVVDGIAARWPLAEAVEITLEANPTSAEQQNFAAFATAGVNRLSLGVQALDDAALQALGRQHTADDARRAWALATEIFPHASFDLIYARPGQSMASWEAELAQALRMQPEHLSAYQLTMEPETPFYRLHQRGRLQLPDDDAAMTMFRLTRQMLADAGLAAYEVSNHARPGAECRHNLLYWRYGPYAGIGPGAHARLPLAGHDADVPDARRLALTTLRQPRAWLQAVLDDNGGNPAGLQEMEALSAEAVATEYLLMSLRTREGAHLHRLHALSGMQPAADVIDLLERQGLLLVKRAADGTALGLRTSDDGLMVLEALLVELTAALQPGAPAPEMAG